MPSSKIIDPSFLASAFRSALLLIPRPLPKAGFKEGEARFRSFASSAQSNKKSGKAKSKDRLSARLFCACPETYAFEAIAKQANKKPDFFIGRFSVGADSGNRTCDLFITSELLYQLSHVGACNNIDNHPPFIKEKKTAEVRFCGAFPA